MKSSNGVYRSPVARLVWDQVVAGSNPVAPTNKKGSSYLEEPFLRIVCCYTYFIILTVLLPCFMI